MIEVTFGESSSGCLKFARANFDEFKKSDIICLGVMADIGDISKPMFGGYRAALLCKMLYQKQWGSDSEMEKDLKRLGRLYAGEFARLKRGLEDGEPVRVWVSAAPYSLCGMLWLSGYLAKYKAEVYAVEMPKFCVKDSVLARFSDWGECGPEYFAERLAFSRRVEQSELRANAMEWQRLVKENAPLRAVITDRVTSVPASFYDFLIWKYLGNSPVKEAVLIGKILGENQLGVGDWWYAQRIEHFTRKKRIVILEDSERKYSRIIAHA